MDIHFDVETTNTFQDPDVANLPRPQQILAMRFGIAVTYDIQDDWKLWLPDEVEALWEKLSQPGVRLVGWNINSFDVPVVRNAAKAPLHHPDPICFDPFDIIRTYTKRWYKLDVIAERNLGRNKTGDGLQAVAWLNSGDPYQIAKAAFYCGKDVELEMEVCNLLDRDKIILPARSERGEKEDLVMRSTGNSNIPWDFSPVATERSLNERPIGHLRSAILSGRNG